MDNNLKKLVDRIIKEELTIATTDGTSSSATTDQKTAAQKAIVSGNSVNFVKKGASLTEEEELDEMARIATYVKVGDQAAFDAALARYAGTWVEDMLTAVKGSEKGLTQPEMVSAAGKTRQQDINPYVRKFQESGALVLGDPSKEKIQRDTVPGALGRRPTEDGLAKKLEKALLAKYLEDPAYEATSELVGKLGQEKIDAIKALAASGGPKRGRKMGAAAPKEDPIQEAELDEMARIATYVKVGDPEAFKAAKQKYAGTWVEDMLDAVAGSEQGLTQPEMVVAAGKQRQQDINPYVRKLMDSMALVLGDPSKEKKVKDTVPGALGRRPSEDGLKAKLAKQLMDVFKDNPDYEPKPALIDALGAEEIERIKQVAAQGGPQRGRKMGAAKPKEELDEMARIPTLYQIGDLEKLDSLGEKAKNSKWVKGIIDFIETEGPQKIIDIATNKFNTRQQAINPIVQSLVNAGVLEPVEGSGKAAVQYNKRGDVKLTTQQKRAAKPDAEDYFVGNHNALGNGEDNDEEVEMNFTGDGEAAPVDDEFAEKEPEIDDNAVEKSTTSASSLSDEEYTAFIDYLKFSDQLKNLKAAITKNKKVKRGGDDLSGGTTGDAEQDRIYALRDKIQAKVDDLVAGSEFLKKRIAKEKGEEYVPPVATDIDDELSGTDDDELDETFTLNEGVKSRFQILAGI